MKKIYTTLALSLAMTGGLLAQTVWTGPKMTFTKANFADFTQPANQDRITSNVWITRSDTMGIFNIATETIYSDFFSPEDTEWAFGTTADTGTVTFAAWENAVNSTPPSMVNQDMVLHLITDDIYIDIKFLSWSGGASGGGFSYERSTNPTISIEENASANTSLRLFPNPSSDFISINGLESTSHFKIINMAGRTVLFGEVNEESKIAINDLPGGIYYIQLNDQSLPFTKK